MTVYTGDHIGRGMLMQCTNPDDMIAFVNRHEFEIYHIYCGGPNVVIVEVLDK